MPRSASSSSTAWYDSPKRRYQRTPARSPLAGTGSRRSRTARGERNEGGGSHADSLPAPGALTAGATAPLRVPPTNNLAERDLRMVKLQQKISARREAPRNRAEVKGLRHRACRSRPVRLGQPGLGGAGKGGSSPDNDGTGRYCQTTRVRQARREGVREEPAAKPRKSDAGSNLVDMGRDAAHAA
jgi:hypothetical protein